MTASFKKGKGKISGTLNDKLFEVISYIILGLFTLLIFYPLYFVVIASVSQPEYVASGQVLLGPKGFNIDGYTKVFSNDSILTGYINSFIYTVSGTIVSVLVTIFAAYPLSRPGLRGKGIFMLYFTITMFISGGMIPTYITIDNLNMMNSIWAIIIPGAVSVYNIVITRTYFQSSIPNELYEAASIDGCGNIRYFFLMVVPLAGPIIAVLVLFTAVGHWNSYFTPMLYFTDSSKYPLQVILRTILIQNQTIDVALDDVASIIEQQQLAEKMKYALIIIASVPVLCLYPMIQKHLVKGIMIGSLKG